MGKNVRRSLERLLFLAVIVLLFATRPVQAAGTEPSVEKAVLINEYYIELHWNTDVTGAGERSSYNVKIDGERVDLPQNDHRYGCDGTYIYTGNGVLYYDRKTTICLDSAITDFHDLPRIEVEIAGNKIKDEAGNYAPQQIIPVDTYEPYYTQEIAMDCGVKILGSAHVRPEAMKKAEEMMQIILANEKIAKRLGDAGCMLCLYGEGENAYDITAHRLTYDKEMLYVEGFGGTQAASIRDANVLRLTTGDYQTNYKNESILVHEFGHTVKNYGLTEEQMKQWNEIWAASIASGKWADSYAGSNSDEFFATLSAMWFNVMDESWEGDWDGVRGPVNTRSELKAYDREAYEFISQVYVSDQYLPAPWANGTVENKYLYKEPEKPAPQDPSYSVSFNYNNSTGVKVQSTSGQLPEPAAPVRAGYIFEAWYNGTEKYDFSQKVTKDLKLDASWKKVTVKAAKIKKLIPKKKKAVLTINKVGKADGYKIIYSKNKKLKKGVRIEFVKKNKVILKKLRKGTWYVRVQAYQFDSAGEKVYGRASKKKRVVIP